MNCRREFHLSESAARAGIFRTIFSAGVEGNIICLSPLPEPVEGNGFGFDKLSQRKMPGSGSGRFRAQPPGGFCQQIIHSHTILTSSSNQSIMLLDRPVGLKENP